MREKLRLFREIDVTTRKKSPGTPKGKKIAMASSFSTNQVVYMPKIICYIDKRQKDERKFHATYYKITKRMWLRESAIRGTHS